MSPAQKMSFREKCIKKFKYYFIIYSNILYILQYTSTKLLIINQLFQHYKTLLPFPRKILSNCFVFFYENAPISICSAIYKGLQHCQFFKFSSKALGIYFWYVNYKKMQKKSIFWPVKVGRSLNKLQIYFFITLKLTSQCLSLLECRLNIAINDWKPRSAVALMNSTDNTLRFYSASFIVIVWRSFIKLKKFY